MKCFFICLLLTLHTTINSQTCIVVKITDTTILIGADSRVVAWSENKESGKIDTTYETLKKIYYNGRYGYGLSGYMAKIGQHYISQGCDKALSLRDVLQVANDSFGLFLGWRLSILRDSFPNKFIYFLTQGLAGIILFGFNGTKPDVWTGEFIPTHNPVTKEIAVRFEADPITTSTRVIGYSR